MLSIDGYDSGIRDNAFCAVRSRRQEEAIMVQSITRWRLSRMHISHGSTFYDVANVFWGINPRDICKEVQLRVQDPLTAKLVKQHIARGVFRVDGYDNKVCDVHVLVCLLG